MRYVIGVSGGVDSVVLLDMLVHYELKLPHYDELIVAHFDHGIRAESAGDAQFVRQLAGNYKLQFELGQAKLGIAASEDEARTARYNFLRQICKKYEAHLVLAHHQDDVVETMIINLSRGTSWRGLISLRSTNTVFRPLLDMTKDDLKKYAEQHHLEWVEDSTNIDQTYLRNYVRHTLIPAAQAKDGSFSHKMIEIYKQLSKLLPEIESALDSLVQPTRIDEQTYICSRYNLTMWPTDVASEYIYHVLTTLDSEWHPERQHILRALHFSKTAPPGRSLAICKGLNLQSQARHIEFKKH